MDGENKKILEEWQLEPKSKFKSLAQLPYRPAERNRLAAAMTFSEITQVTEHRQDTEKRQHRKWRELRKFWKLQQKSEYNKCSIENALWVYGHTGITVDQFIMAMTCEFNFDRSLNSDSLLRWLYLSCNGGGQDRVDWRDIVASLQIVTLFRLVKDFTLDLMMGIFDIYSFPEDSSTMGKSARGEVRPGTAASNNMSYISDLQTFLKIFLLPIVTDRENKRISETLEAAINRHFKLSALDLFPKITRHEFREFMVGPHGEDLLKDWGQLAWERLPTELRLIVLDEAQLVAIAASENITQRFRLSQALILRQKSVYRKVIKEWKIIASRGGYVRNHLNRTVIKKRNAAFMKWLDMARRRTLRRRRAMLAEVMGEYTVKGRMFARIKLYNYSTKLILRAAGKFDENPKLIYQGFSRMREFYRLSGLREIYHRWWNQCVVEQHEEVATRHRFILRTQKKIWKWHEWAKESAYTKRQDLICLENQKQLHDMLQETEEAVELMMNLEDKRRDRREKAEEEAAVVAKKAKIEKSKNRIQSFKDDDVKLMKSMQYEARRKRVRKEMGKIKKDFKIKWKKKTKEILDLANFRMTTYIASKDAELAIQLRFEKLKREFFAPPAPENAERERILTSAKNIVFLFLEQKMLRDKIQLENVLIKFDNGKKNYLTYEEFRQMVNSLKTGLSPHQISEAIRDVDADGDEVIELHELKDSMKEVGSMGVVGSPWKMYIDPAQDVILYHNFDTHHKIFEYKMTDEILKEINVSNFFGESRTNAEADALQQKKEDWDIILRNYLARRLQWMYRQWKCRKLRKSKIWKVENKAALVIRGKHNRVVDFIEMCFVAAKVRAKFKRQLFLTYEKVWDVDEGRMFWRNHHLNTSTWERPALLWRYGDVDTPTPWVAVDMSTATSEAAGDPTGPSDEQNDLALPRGVTLTETKYGYYHVQAKRSLPRKPDGLPLCGRCRINVALRYCNDCQMYYCFPCTRDVHQHPQGFFQRKQVTAKQKMNGTFLSRLEKHNHNWVSAEGTKCEMCASDKILAAYYCTPCGKNLCRPCFRRIHSHSTKSGHEAFTI